MPHYENELDIEVGVMLNQFFFKLAFAHVAVVQFEAVLPDRGVGRSLKSYFLQATAMQKLSDNIPDGDVMIE